MLADDSTTGKGQRQCVDFPNAEMVRECIELDCPELLSYQ